MERQWFASPLHQYFSKMEIIDEGRWLSPEGKVVIAQNARRPPT